jgi:hypothetical protein
MKREVDNNRVKRAMEHVMAAITNINSIKIIDRTPMQNMLLEQAKKQLADGWRTLRLTEGGIK